MTTGGSGALPNIGPRGIARRRTSGLISLGVALLLAVVLLWLDAPRWARLIVFLPLLSAGIGLFQAKEKT